MGDSSREIDFQGRSVSLRICYDPYLKPSSFVGAVWILDKWGRYGRF